jgi:hypothetical protein
LTGGIYRLVCGNGLIVGNPLFSRSVIHKGNAIEKVLEAATDLIEISPISVKTIKEWEKIELSDKQKEIYSESAKMLKWDKDEEINILPSQLLRSRRYEDKKNDLWTTFNVIQENIIKGGLRYRKSNDKRLNSTRGTSSITENVRLNTALWNLTEKMAELAA